MKKMKSLPKNTFLQRSMIGIGIGLIFVAGYATEAQAGINVEQYRGDTEHPGFFGDVQLSFSLNYGNTNLASLGSGGVVGYRNRNHILFLLGGASFATDFKNRLANKETGHLRYNYRLLDRVWWETFVQAEHDEFLLVRLRALGGIGLRFLPWDKKLRVAYGTSIMPEYEMLDGSILVNPPPSQANTFVPRWNNYLTLIYFVNDRVKLQTTGYIQPRFDKFEDFRVMNDNVFDVEIVGKLELNVTVSLRYDSMPASFCLGDLPCVDDQISSLQRLDVGTQTGFAWEF